MFSSKVLSQWPRTSFHLDQLVTRSGGRRGVSSVQQVIDSASASKADERVDEEWMNAKDYESMPGPSTIGLLSSFLPGGKFHNSNLIEMNRQMRSTYGDIYRLKGVMGKLDTVFTYNPADIELTYRHEGVWPIRVGLDSFAYYRREQRPDVFQGIGGLVTEQGKEWADIRNKVNPVMMKTQTVRRNLPQIDQVANEFMDKLESLRDETTNTLRSSFLEELKMWAFEAISVVALNTRMGLMTDRPDPNARRLADNMSAFFQYSYEYDVSPSYWKYIHTPGFKRLLQTYDNITDITTTYVEQAIAKFEAEGNREAQSVLEKLFRIDKRVAVVMAIDMLMAGIDTTSSAFVTILYHIARNPAKQELLRRELNTLMPTKTTALTEQNTKNMPYLRSCIKEALRITSITPGNFRVTVKDLVMSGYRVPRGTGVLMGVMELCNEEKHFPRAAEFLPERWLKSGPAACPAAKPSSPFVYLPFGFGPRTCIGKRIAEMEIETLMAKIIRNYRVSWTSDEDLKYISNIILLPREELSFKFEPID